MRSNQVITVSQLNYYIKTLLDGDEALNSVYLVGEISNFTNHYKSGHLYFSLKDEKCVVKCVMFASYAGRVRFRPQDGMRVLARGRVSLYEASGQYQLYIEDLQPDGVGALSLAYEQLKRKLEREGLFDVARKKSLPLYPARVGVITSPTGAAVHDIQTVLARRYPLAQVVFCPVLVQGEDAAPQIVEAIRRFNAAKAADVLIVGRGGGSLEELWAFNEETVARAVAASRIPVISAVGHETDFTICDFAADLRAPTPSAAAELAVPDQGELMALLRGQELKMRHGMAALLQIHRQRLDRLMSSRSLRSPYEQIERRRLHVDALSGRLERAMSKRVSAEQRRFASLSGKLESLSPLHILSRGYSIAQNDEGNPVKSINDVQAGQNLTVRVSDGIIDCAVLSTEKGTKQ